MQIAELVASCIGDAESSANKTVEAVAIAGAPETEASEMLAAIEADISVADMLEAQAALGDARSKRAALEAEAEAIEAELAAAEEAKVLAERAFSDARSELDATRKEVHC